MNWEGDGNIMGSGGYIIFPGGGGGKKGEACENIGS